MNALVQKADIQQSIERVPNQLAEKIVPVLSAEPIPQIKNIAFNRSTSGGVTIATTHATKKTYLTSIHFSRIKDATCDEGTGYAKIQVSIQGETVDLVRLATLTLTAQSQDIFLTFDRPILVDKGSPISLGTVTYSAGSQNRVGSIQYYEVEVH